jgi:hypothetical protein
MVNDKTYVGVHSTDYLNDGYIGCGILNEKNVKSQLKANRTSPLISAINKYGYKNFSVEILSFFDTKEEAYEEESFLVDYNWVKSKDNYNAKVGGLGGSPPSILHEHKNKIIEMYLNGASYIDISKKYNVSKGSYVNFLTPYMGNKKRKKSFYLGMEFENAYGDVVVFKDPESFYERTGVSTKTLHKIKSRSQVVAYGNVAWFTKGSIDLLEYRDNFFSNKQHWRLTRALHDERRFISAVKNRSKK